MRIDYYLGIIRAELYFREARSLKDRRGHVRSLTDRLSNMGFSVTRTGPPDLPRQAWLVAVVASGSGSWIRRKLERAGDLFYDPRWELMDISMDIIAADQELPDWETT